MGGGYEIGGGRGAGGPTGTNSGSGPEILLPDEKLDDPALLELPPPPPNDPKPEKAPRRPWIFLLNLA
jgi:hypothetical protein